MKIFKIIYKYINKNNFHSYYHLIFIKNISSNNIKIILDKIKDLSIEDCLNELNKKELKLLNKEFGPDWIKYFFNLEHIHYHKNKIKKFMKGGNDFQFDENIDINENNKVEENNDESFLDLGDNDIIDNISTEDFITNKMKINKNIDNDTILIKSNNNLDSILLKNSFQKIYIYDTEIMSNDNIELLCKKICNNISIEINDEPVIFIPSRLYLWASNLETSFSISLKNTEINAKPIFNKNEEYKKIIIKDNNNIILNDIPNIYNVDIFFSDIYTSLYYQINILNTNIKILQNNFIKIYFSKSLKHLNEIILYLKNTNENYNIKNEIFSSIKSELEYNDKIYNILNESKNININEIYITHAIFVSYIYNNNNSINLKNIFNFLKLNKQIVYSKLLDIDNKLYYKVLKSFKEEDKLQSWNNQNQFGITLKYYYDNRYITINIIKTGLLEMKLQWKEIDNTKLQSIDKYKTILHNVLQKINKECDISINNISDIQIKFLNTIQKFNLPEKINHNKFSNFIRLFHPIFSLVIDPDKRKTTHTINESSKWGTYLRYKKISNYDNEIIIFKKVLYYLRNFYIQDKDLIEIIAKEFNLSEKNSIEFINKIKKIYSSYIQKFNKIKKKNFDKDNIKLEKKGIEVAIQGKEIDKYKIRIEGSRSFYEIEMISEYINKILYLYISLYIKKNNKYKYIENEFKNITHISKRKGQVVEFEEKQIQQNYKILNEMKNKDSRISTKNTESRYSRECQNSGDKIRRPLQITNENELINNHKYIYNKKLDVFEKKINKEETLYALKHTVNDNSLYYICDEKIHKDRKFIGILSKRKNNLPCCFIKNQLNSKNKLINETFKNSLFPNKKKNNNISINPTLNDFNIDNIKYIRKLKNIIQDQRFFELPSLLDKFFNKILNNQYKFFLYGVNKELNILEVLNLYVNKDDIFDDMKKKMYNLSNEIFFSLNNGKTYLEFKNINVFIQNINNNLHFKHYIDLFSILYEFNIIIIQYINENDDYFIKHNNIFNEENSTIFLYNDGINIESFYPIVNIDKNIILKDFFIENKDFINFYNIINNSNRIDYQFYKNNNINIKYQIINKNKLVDFYITDNNIPIPAFNDTPIYNIPITTRFPSISLQNYIKFINNFSFFKINSYIYKNSFIIGIYLNVFNKFYNIFKLIKIKKHKIQNYNNYVPLLENIQIKTLSSKYNLFKFNINKYKIKNEMYYVYKYLFSINLKPFRKIIIDISKEQNIDLLLDYIIKINKTFISISKLEFDDWCQKHIQIIIKYNFLSYLDKNNSNNLYLKNNHLNLPKDLYLIFVKNIHNQLLYDITVNNEILNLNNMFISKIIDNNKILIQENELLFFKDFKIIKKFTEVKNIYKNEKINYIKINKNILHQPVKNDNFAIIRAFVNSLYYNIYIEQIKNYNICNIGYYSNFQQNTTLFFIGEIIKFGLDNFKILKYDENIFYNLYYNNNISKYYLLILQILSIITNKPIYLEYNDEFFLIFKKIQKINKIKNSKIISIKIITINNSFLIKEIFVILNIQKYII